MSSPDHPSVSPIDRLLTIMAKLRAPQGGCPWDIAQSFTTIAPHTIEEAYEVVEAIEAGDKNALKDELGDLLFQVVFYAQMAKEEGSFDFKDVVAAICEKMERRHPHVFGDASVADAAAQTVQWEAQKAQERQQKAGDRPPSALEGVSTALPAQTRALKLQARAGRVGFDWDGAAGVRAKIDEELAELDRALADGRKDQIAEELGDLLFAISNWSRHLDLDAEQALRAASLKFERRFECMEEEAQRARLSLESLSPAQWEQLWSVAKSLNGKR